MKYYYTNAANQPLGPVTLEELQQLLAKGEIHLATNVVGVGETTWRPLSSLLTSPAATSAPPLATASPGPATAPVTAAGATPVRAASSFDLTTAPTLLATTVGKLLDWVRGLFLPIRVQGWLGFLRTVGQFLVLTGGALSLITAIVFAIKLNSFQAFLFGLGGLLVIILVQYVAIRFLDACLAAVKNSPSKIASSAVPDSVALILLIASIAAVIQSIILSIQISSGAPLLPAFVGALLMIGAAAVALQPSLANVAIAGETSAGQEAIGLLSFLTKESLVLMPLLFCLYALAGNILLIASLFGANPSFLYVLVGFLPEMIRDLGGGMVGSGLVVVACVLPLVGYLGFLFYYLLVDLIQAILSIPAKLDALRR